MRVLIVVLATIAGGVLLSRLAQRLGAGRALRTALGWAPAVVVVTLTFALPALTTRTLVEAFPEAVPSADAGATVTAPTATAATAAAPTSTPTVKQPTVGPSAVTQPTVRQPTAAPQPARSSQPPAAPTLIASGTLRGHAGHRASGRVSTYRLTDGSNLIRFEEVSIQGTPSPVVYLIKGADKTSKSGGTRLGNLKAEKGSFNYRLPASWDIGETFTVLVWCETYSVPITSATQR